MARNLFSLSQNTQRTFGDSKRGPFLLQEEMFALEGYVKDFWEFLPMPICYVSPTFSILDIDKNFETFSGYETNEIVGENLSVLLASEATFKALVEELSKQEKIANKEIPFLGKNKKEILVSLSATARKDINGNTIGYFFAFFEVAESKNLEKQLKEKLEESQVYAKDLEQTRVSLLNILEDVAEERKKAEQERDRNVSIIRHLADGILILSQSKIILVNPVFERIFVVKASEVIGHNIASFLKHSSIGPVVKLLKEKNFNLQKDKLELNKDLVLEITTTLMAKVGEEPEIMVVARDITREKLIDKMKTDFVSIAAHQLRTPLSAIKWMVRMMLDGDMGKISSTQKEFLDKTYQTNERMIRLVNDLLNVTRIEEGRFLRDVEKGDIIKVIEKVIECLQDSAKNKGLELNFINLISKKDYPQIYLDKEKISSALQNLIENGLHYTQKGSVSVSVAFDESHKEFLIKVQDTGMGISLEQQSHIFQRFFRAINAVHAETEGTGLGLFIAKNIIESHGGRIWFESKENVGTTFFVALPVLEREAVKAV